MLTTQGKRKSKKINIVLLTSKAIEIEPFKKIFFCNV